MNISSVGSSTVLPSTPGTPTAATAAYNRQLVQAANIVNNHAALGNNNEIVFVMDRATHRAIMRVVDRKTQDVVMQLPPEYVLRLAEDLKSADHQTSS